MEFPDQNGLSSPFSNHLSRRLLETRTIVHNGGLTSPAVGQIVEQLTVLDGESEEPIDFVITSAPRGSFEAALSLYDLIRSLTAPLRMLGSGHIAGAGVVAFVGASMDRRFALPNARFQLKEPGTPPTPSRTSDAEKDAEILRDRRERIRLLLSKATGQPEGNVQVDLEEQTRLDAEEAVDYGLVRRVVESRDEIA